MTVAELIQELNHMVENGDVHPDDRAYIALIQSRTDLSYTIDTVELSNEGALHFTTGENVGYFHEA